LGDTWIRFERTTSLTFDVDLDVEHGVFRFSMKGDGIVIQDEDNQVVPDIASLSELLLTPFYPGEV
jgi:hypothetical protein